MPQVFTDSHQWIAKLSSLSPTISRIASIGAIPLAVYQQSANAPILQTEAYNFANDADHNDAFARCFDGLSANGANDTALQIYLGTLTNGVNTYGTASELLSYLWLLDRGAMFEIQIPMTGQDILNPNGSDLDGKLTFNADVYFDIKGFGFQENMIEKLIKRLETDIPNHWIAAQGSWDVAAETLQDLLAKNYGPLLNELRQNTMATRGTLTFIKRSKTPIQTSHRMFNPYQFAEENNDYVFRFAKQFCRNQPFLLILAHHPWLGGKSFHTNFANSAAITSRALARRAFVQFLSDSSPTFGVSKADASKMLSGIGFLNVSQIGGAASARNNVLDLYLNPNATSPISRLTVDNLRMHIPHSVVVDDFVFDNY